MILAYKSEIQREKKNEISRTQYLRTLGQFQKYKICVMNNREEKKRERIRKKKKVIMAKKVPN